MAEDISGLPDVDLGPVIADLENQDKGPEPKPPTVTTDVKSDHPERNELGQFKSQEELLKGYKNVQAFATTVSQRNKALEAEIAKRKEQDELEPPPVYHQPSTNNGSKGNFDEQFIENPQQAITSTYNQLRISEVLEEERIADSDSFNQRYAYASNLAANPKYSHLASTPAGIRKLFEVGDKLREREAKASAFKSLETIFGEPLDEEDLGRLKTLVKGKKDNKPQTNKSDAYMPDTSTSTKLGADEEQKPTYDNEISDAVEKAYVDGTLHALFKKVLA